MGGGKGLLDDACDAVDVGLRAEVAGVVPDV